jgi:hypothetical protein
MQLGLNPRGKLYYDSNAILDIDILAEHIALSVFRVALENFLSISYF